MEPNPALAVKVTNTSTKVKDAKMDKARAEGLVKMKAARAIKTAQKNTDVGMTSLGAVTEALAISYWICSVYTKSKHVIHNFTISKFKSITKRSKIQIVISKCIALI